MFKLLDPAQQGREKPSVLQVITAGKYEKAHQWNKEKLMAKKKGKKSKKGKKGKKK